MAQAVDGRGARRCRREVGYIRSSLRSRAYRHRRGARYVVCVRIQSALYHARGRVLSGAIQRRKDGHGLGNAVDGELLSRGAGRVLACAYARAHKQAQNARDRDSQHVR